MDLIFRSINSEAFENIYKDLLNQFPVKELKTYDEFLELLGTDEYKIYQVIDNNVEVAYVILFEDKVHKVIWLDYIVVFTEFHSLGYGSRILDGLKSLYPDYTGCYLEVEKVNSDDITTVRRVKFYKKNGAEKLDINYIYPNNYGGLEMDLYFIPYKEVSVGKEFSIHVIQYVFSKLHNNILCINDILTKILE